MAKVNNKMYVTKDNTTLIELVNLSIDQLITANKIGDNTYLDKQCSANIISTLEIANKPIQDIDIPQINNALGSLVHYSNSIINKVYRLMANAFDLAVLLKVITNSPFAIKKAIIKPVSLLEDKDVEALTLEEHKAFLHQLTICKDTYRDIFFILIYTGMRIGEVLALNSSDIDINNKIIKVERTLTKDKSKKIVLGTKTKTYAGKRDVPIITPLLPIMIKLSKQEGYLFLQPNGKWINPSTINSHIKRISKDAGIKVTTVSKKKKLANNVEKQQAYKSSLVHTHMLRHTFATRCIEAGMSAVALSRTLGHKNIETTLNTYTSVFNQFKKDEMVIVEQYLFTQLAS